MSTTKQRVRVTFAGLEFSGIEHGADHITVPVSVLKRLLRERRVSVHLDYDIEHDGDGTRDQYHHDVASERLAEWCDRQLQWLADCPRRPWLLYLRSSKGVIHYCPHSNKAYTLLPT